MPAKFSGLRVAAGDVHVFYGPCGGGYGDPLERPAAKVLDDVLDGFCTVEHARTAYGVVVDALAESVDEAATKALRERMRAVPRSTAAAAARPPQAVLAPQPRATPTPQPPGNGARPSTQPVAQAAANGNDRALADALRGLRRAYGENWSFEVVRHSANGATIEVVGQLRASGTTVRETAVSTAERGHSLGEMLEQTANDSLRKCAETLMRNGH